MKEELIVREHLPITIIRERTPAIRDNREGMTSPRQVEDGIYIDATNHHDTQVKRARIMLERYAVAPNHCLLTFHPVERNDRPRRQTNTATAAPHDGQRVEAAGAADLGRAIVRIADTSKARQSLLGSWNAWQTDAPDADTDRRNGDRL